jgi:hypothetical protein
MDKPVALTLFLSNTPAFSFLYHEPPCVPERERGQADSLACSQPLLVVSVAECELNSLHSGL